MTKLEISIPGTSELPALLPHPGFISFADAPINNMLCYIIRHHESSGPTLLISRTPAADRVMLRLGTWDGTIVDFNKDKHIEMLKSIIPKLTNFMSVAKIIQCQLYFSADLTLVDVRTMLNKFIGPGMLKEIFGRLVATPETVKLEAIDQRARDAILEGSGEYQGNLIIKPSRYRNTELSNRSWVPLYGELVRPCQAI